MFCDVRSKHILMTRYNNGGSPHLSHDLAVFVSTSFFWGTRVLFGNHYCQTCTDGTFIVCSNLAVSVTGQFLRPTCSIL